MRFPFPSPILVLVLTASLTLSGCKSAEERAEERYQSGLELIESGDFDRAIVEFRSVFELKPNHLEARRALADLLLSHKDNLQGAYSQYLRLAEQYPNDLETRVVLAELAFRFSNWEEVDRHGAKAHELNPEDARVKAIQVARDYRTAAQSEENADRRDHARAAKALLEEQSDNILLRSLLIDNDLRENNLSSALAGIDWILERDPDDLRSWRQRLSILAQLQDHQAIEDQLRQMITQFADDDSHKAMLIRYYLSRQEIDKAEAFLRELASNNDEIGPRVDLIRFLAETKGPDAALAEANAALKDHPGNIPLQIVQASVNFTLDKQDEAIAALEAILDDPPEGKLAGDVRVTLARMLLQTDNVVSARARVEEALEADPQNVNALKMRAAWLIESDDTDGAIAALRTALDNQSEDAQAMTLMAQAYIRAGSQDLARDFLALAVEASGNAPEESIRYATVLIQDERHLPAEDILLAALRLAPSNPQLLVTLGQLYLEMDDLGRVEQVARTLRNLGTDEAIQTANGLDAERINRQSGPQDALNYLSELANSADATLAAKISLIRGRLGTGDTEGALELSRSLVEENPDNLLVKSLQGSIEAANGALDTAEAIYEEVLDEAPELVRVWLELSRVKSYQGDREGSLAVIDRGLSAVPEEPTLLWAKATAAEQNGDIDSAIAIYEDLYALNSSWVVVANNLASLLSSYKADDPANLERAYAISRRLRNSKVPQLQDTYGWISHLYGDSEEALSYMESAAEKLPRDPLVQFHLAEVYHALGRADDALASYRTAVTIAGEADTRPQIDKARAQIVALENAAASDGGTEAGSSD